MKLAKIGDLITNSIASSKVRKAAIEASAQDLAECWNGYGSELGKVEKRAVQIAKQNEMKKLQNDIFSKQPEMGCDYSGPYLF